VVILVGLGLVGVGLAVRGGSDPTAAASSRPTDGPPASPTSSAPSPTSSTSSPSSSPVSSATGGATRGYLVLPDDLTQRTAAGTAGDGPYAAARDELLGFAEEALKHPPRPMANLDIPGTEGPFVDDTAIAYGLGLAYAMTGDVRYAQQSRAYIDAWVGTTQGLVNACPDDGGCQTSLIVARVVPGFVFAADLIRPSGVLSADDDAALKGWLERLILPDLPTRAGNWGDAGTFSRAVITDYLGDADGFAKAIQEWRTRMDAVPADGHLPDEVRRGDDGMSYTQEALQYKVATARLAELRGIDLWSYKGKQGATLRGALDVLSTYWFRPADWPWDPNVRVPSPSPMWELAYQHWQEPAWTKIFAGDRPFSEDGHSAVRWTTMTNGIPIK
jgi:Alginate lyase